MPLSCLFSIMLLCMLQEVVFYEDGEPIIDGEPGDLKVSSNTVVKWFHYRRCCCCCCFCS
jgi:hypothetical protein